MGTDKQLKEMFNQVALDYDEVRPGYPSDLVEDIIRLSGLPEDARILEVGCGTGIATRPFAERGYSILCLDIGAQLLALAEKNLKAFENVAMELVSFEEWEPEGQRFDLCMSASAFHWIETGVGYPKVASVLKPSSSMAIFTHYHPTPLTGFFEEVQTVYQRIVPEWKNPADNPPIEQFIAKRTAAIDDCAVFQPVTVRQYPWAKDFNTEQYLKLLNTYSGHRALEENRRSALFQGIADVIDKNYNGTVVRPYLSVLYFARSH